MGKYRAIKGISSIYIIFLTVLTNVFIVAFMNLINSYVIISLLKVAIVVMNIYFLYYLLLSVSLCYIIGEENLIIHGFWGLRKIKIPFSSMEGYNIHEGNIRGVKLSGIGNDRFAFGRTIIDKIGTTHMFVSSNKRTIYIKTSSISYAVSPEKVEGILHTFKENGISDKIVEHRINKNVDLYKEKAFLIPFIIVTILIIALTLYPFVLYLKNLLPARMPLSFNAMFVPITYGTGKQFAFKQMTYGVLNMIILLCMYYASYFCAKYDRKTAYKYIYAAMATSLTFFAIQIRILMAFR